MGLSAAQIDVYVGDGTTRTLHDDVLDGLTRPSKELPPKHLYDTFASELFTGRAADIVAATRMGELVELGSGSATKTRVLLDAATEAGTLRRYVPFDVAEVVEPGSGPTTGCCSAPTSSRIPTCSRPPTTTRRASPPPSTATC